MYTWLDFVTKLQKYTSFLHTAVEQLRVQKLKTLLCPTKCLHAANTNAIAYQMEEYNNSSLVMILHCLNSFQHKNYMEWENHLINYLMLFVSGTHILSNRSSPPKVPFKKGTQKIFAKPTGKQLCHRLPFNKDKTPAHVFSCEICETLKNIPPYRAPPGAAAVVTHILKIIELPPGLEKNSITNYVDLCCFHVLHLLFSLYTRHGVTRKRNTKRLRHTGNV